MSYLSVARWYVAWDRMISMRRQCAWCLRFMNDFGEPVSAPQPKNYELSHGMCRLCGSLWLEQAIHDTEPHKAQKHRPSISRIEDIK